MPTWIPITVNAVLMAYCVFMFILGLIKKKKRIKEAKEEIRKEFQNEKENHDDCKQN